MPPLRSLTAGRGILLSPWREAGSPFCGVRMEAWSLVGLGMCRPKAVRAPGFILLLLGQWAKLRGQGVAPRFLPGFLLSPLPPSAEIASFLRRRLLRNASVTGGEGMRSPERCSLMACLMLRSLSS